jgi:hypothetical protein
MDTVDHTSKVSSCESVGAASPCVANGAMIIDIDGQRHSAPGLYDLSEGYSVAVANLPHACKERSSTYKIQHAYELDGHNRRLADQPFEQFITDRDLLNASECKEWLAKATTETGGTPISSRSFRYVCSC